MPDSVPERDQPWLMRTYSGHSTAARVERAVSHEPREGSDRPLHRVRPADADRIRPRLADGQGRGRQGRRAGRASRSHAHAARRHPARADEHLDDDQRDGGMAARPLRRERRRAGRRVGRPQGHDPERHREGVPVERHVHLPARPEPSADRRHGGVVCAPRTQVEPDQRLQLPPAGGRRDSRAGDRVRAGHRDRCARRGAGVRPGRGRTVPCGLRLDLVLRERGHPLRRRGVQAPGAHRPLGPHRPRALWRSPIPRCAGSAMGCRSTRSGSPKRSPRTTCSASSSSCSRSRSRSGPGPGRSSCRRGTRRSVSLARGTSSGRCGCNKCWPSRRTCSSTRTSSTARR